MTTPKSSRAKRALLLDDEAKKIGKQTLMEKEQSRLLRTRAKTPGCKPSPSYAMARAVEKL